MSVSVLIVSFFIGGCIEQIPDIGNVRVLVDLQITGPGTVVEGGLGNYSAVATYDDGSKATLKSGVTWSVDGGVGSIDNNGTYKAVTGLTTDSETRIEASYTELGVTRKASTSINVSNSDKILISIAIVGPDTVAEGGTGYFTLRASYDDGSTENVTNNALWTVEGPGSITSGGVFSAGSVTSHTLATISVVYTEGEVSKNSSVDILVTDTSVKVTGLSISGADSIQSGTNTSFTASAQFDDGSSRDVTHNVTWEVTSGPGSINNAGEYTAPSDIVSDASVVIGATYQEEGTAKQASYNLTVTMANITANEILAGVSVSVQSSGEVSEGGVINCIATANYQDGHSADVSSSSTWEIVSGSGTISSTGEYRAPAEVNSNMTVTVRGSYTEGGKSFSGTASISVVSSVVTLNSVSISGPSTMTEKGTGSYKATANYSNGTSKDVTAGSDWSVSFGAGEIEGNGFYSAPSSAVKGSVTTIHVNYREGDVIKTSSKGVYFVDGSSEDELIGVGDVWKYFRGRQAPEAGWNTAGFDDGSWESGSSGIGYSDDISYASTLGDMQGNYVTFYARKTFQISNAEQVSGLELRLQYDDGFIAYVNGREVARSSSMGGTQGTAVGYNVTAESSHDEEAAAESYNIDLSSGLLSTGTNVLAIEIHNVASSSSDAGLIPSLSVTYSAAADDNAPPAANGGLDRTLTDSQDNGTVQVSLDASQSYDSDGTIVDYVWKEGDTVLARGISSEVSLPVGKDASEHTITLVVTDNGGLNDAHNITCTIDPPLVANAGPDQNVSGSNDDGSGSVTLNGAGSKVYGSTISSYTWTENGVQIASGVNPQVTLASGTHNIVLTVSDARGNTKEDSVSVVVSASSTSGSWVPPVGVPAPPFGITETNEMYAGKTFEFGNGAEAYHDAGNGPYTHYVDNTSPAATDDNNPYGTQNKPRMTIPTDLVAGSVVEIHGGPYTSGLNYVLWNSQGTAQKPVFIRGVNAVISHEVRIAGSYLIVENLKFVGTNINMHRNYAKDHIAIRNVEITDFMPGGFGQAINIANASDIVIYNNHIHHCGDCNSSVEDDVHGVAVIDGSERIWIVDNNIHHNGGDAVQVNAYRTRDGASIKNVYIARNELHNDRENAIDIKASTDVIISQNLIYGYQPTVGAGSDGAAIVGGHENSQRTWIIYNDISDACHAIRVNDDKNTPDVYIVGNVIHNIHHASSDYDPSDLYSQGSAIVTWYAVNMYIVNNTIYDADAGFCAAGYGDGKYYLVNNIIANIAEKGAYHIGIASSTKAGNSTMNHNLIYQSDGSINIRWGGGYYGSIADFQASGQGGGCIESNPQFADVDEGNFNLLSGSPAIDAGVEDGVYQTFYNLYGLNIKVDKAGDQRPSGSGYDIGAYEQ